MVTRTVQIKGRSGNHRLEGPSQRRDAEEGEPGEGESRKERGGTHPRRPRGRQTTRPRHRLVGRAAVAHGGQLCGLPGWEDLAHQAQGHGDGWDPVAPSCPEDDSFSRAHLA